MIRLDAKTAQFIIDNLKLAQEVLTRKHAGSARIHQIEQVRHRLQVQLDRPSAIQEARRALKMLRKGHFNSTKDYILSKKRLMRFLDYVDAQRYYRMLREIERVDLDHNRQTQLAHDANSLKKLDPHAKSIFRIDNQQHDYNRELRNAKSTEHDLTKLLAKKRR